MTNEKLEKTVAVEIETSIRSAQKGEWVLGINGLECCPGYDHNRYRGYVIRRFITSYPEDFLAEYPDTNGNGIPDAFENRPSIIEILKHD